MSALKVRNKNAMLELLKGGIDFEKITIVNNLKQDKLTQEILSVAEDRKIQIKALPIQQMVKRRSGETREVLVGFLKNKNDWTLKTLLDSIYKKNQEPFFLLINRIDFESNIGTVARTAFAAGVNGLIFQGKEEEFFNEDTIHFSMGAIARIPLVKISIFEALKEFKKNNIRTFSIQMGGSVYFNEDFSGPVAFVLGAERKGVSDTVSNRCDKKISIPMKEGIDSLNVGTSASIILYEKIRQEGVDYLVKNSYVKHK